MNYLGSYREFECHEDGTYWQQSHELRLATNGDGPLKAQVGGYYFEERSGIGF